MYLLVAALLLAHLGATLTGAWRASQPRLQFTHSGKIAHLFLSFLLIFALMFPVFTHTQVAGIMQRFPLFTFLSLFFY